MGFKRKVIAPNNSGNIIGDVAGSNAAVNAVGDSGSSTFYNLAVNTDGDAGGKLASSTANTCDNNMGKALNNAAVKNDSSNAADKDTYKKQRVDMVATQIIPRGIKNEKVIDAMLKVKREKFTETGMQQFAYEDRPLPISHGQTISQPYIVALMTELLELKGNEKVLEIGTGSGYQTAVLAEIAFRVYSVEIIKPLYDRVGEILSNYKNIHLKNDDGYNGWKEFAPYDRIITTAAPEIVPQPLLDQMADGGIMVLPRGFSGWSQELLKIRKTGNRTITERICDVAFVPLTRNTEV